MDKSWATQGVVGEIQDRSAGIGPAARTGLNFFMAVLTSMFFLFIVGYRLRMAEADWVAINDPAVLWLNSGVLVAAGWVMQQARDAARQGLLVETRNKLTLTGILTIAFIAGQYLAWQQLANAGYYVATSPAAAFFALLTFLHAFHLSGGLLVLVRATFFAWRGEELQRIKLSIELCTTYWHYLLLVWFVFFALLLTT